jgi:hypothetical protein
LTAIALVAYLAIPRPLARYDFLRTLDPTFEELRLPIVHPNQKLPTHDPKQWVFRFKAAQENSLAKLLKSRLPAQGFSQNPVGNSPDTPIAFSQVDHGRRETVTLLTGSDAAFYACSMSDPDHPRDERAALQNGCCVVLVETENTWIEDQIRVLSHRLGFR